MGRTKEDKKVKKYNKSIYKQTKEDDNKNGRQACKATRSSAVKSKKSHT